MKISAAILAGGKSRRMGQDKALILFKGKAMITHSLNALEGMNIPISIIANSSEYEQFGYPVIGDEIPDKGPLGGIYTALLHSSTEKVLILPCDSPFLNKTAIDLLLDKSENELATVATQNGAIHPLFAVYSKELLSEVKSEIDSGNLKVIDAIRNYKKVNFDDVDPMIFANLNTMEELITWQQ